MVTIDSGLKYYYSNFMNSTINKLFDWLFFKIIANQIHSTLVTQLHMDLQDFVKSLSIYSIVIVAGQFDDLLFLNCIH